MKTFLASLVAASALLSTAASAAIVTTNPQTFISENTAAATYNLGATYDGNVLVDFKLGYTGVLKQNSYLGLYFGAQSTGPSFGLKANCNKASGCFDDVYGRTKGADGSFVPNSNLIKSAVAGATPYHIVGYLQKTGGSDFYNQIDVWLNPESTNLDDLLLATTKHASFTGLSSISEFSTIGIRTYLVDSTRPMTIDDINISAIPEPGSIALMGLALAGMSFAKRRKAK